MNSQAQWKTITTNLLCSDAATRQLCLFISVCTAYVMAALALVWNEMSYGFDRDSDNLKIYTVWPPVSEGTWSQRGTMTSFEESTASSTSVSFITLSWGQFLNAPQRLARQMKSLSRLPSICQKAAVWVTCVRWLMQNLKQNSSKSWTSKGKTQTIKLFCILS